MINLEKVTVFHRVWNETDAVNQYIPQVCDGHWYEHQIAVAEAGGVKYERRVKLRIPQADMIIAREDRIAQGRHTTVPDGYATVTAVSHNKKGANPHWLVMAK